MTSKKKEMLFKMEYNVNCVGNSYKRSGFRRHGDYRKPSTKDNLNWNNFWGCHLPENTLPK
jgi:hypothetical protein